MYIARQNRLIHTENKLLFTSEEKEGYSGKTGV